MPASPPPSALRTVFFGTGDIALPSFHALAGRPDITLVGLVTQPDKPVGRHQILTPPRIKQEALALGIPVWQPEKSRLLVPMLESLHADLFLVMAYGQILPESLIRLPCIACWNLHASLLPRHRGASPIQAAILAGDSETGVTVMHVARELDAGDLVHSERLAILPDETGSSLHDRLAALAPAAMLHALDLLQTGHAPRLPQDPASVTVLGKLERSHGHLDWSMPAAGLERRIRAFDPWPGTFTRTPCGAVLKIFPPAAVTPAMAEPGTILESGPNGLHIACGGGGLRIQSVQPEGKRRMSAADYLRGHPLAPGTLLSSRPPEGKHAGGGNEG